MNKHTMENVPDQRYLEEQRDTEETVEEIEKSHAEIDLIFQESPELGSIGSPQEYGSYLKTIFPNSKFKNIFFHGTGKELEKDT